MLWHFAYTFDSDTAHQVLLDKILVDNKLDLYQLQTLAKTIISNADETALRRLFDFRYDEEWLDDPDGDTSQAYLWYMVYLNTYFNEAPSLSNNRLKFSHSLLEHSLPYLGWSQREVYDLLFGQQLETILEGTDNQVLLEYLSLHGGCLSNSVAHEILLKMEKLKQSFYSPDIELVDFLEKKFYIFAVERLPLAYLDAIDMLTTAIERKEALFLLRDF